VYRYEISINPKQGSFDWDYMMTLASVLRQNEDIAFIMDERTIPTGELSDTHYDNLDLLEISKLMPEAVIELTDYTTNDTPFVVYFYDGKKTYELPFVPPEFCETHLIDD